MSLTDADDSIVLSDLLRSGEASRLRRRGAIFIRDPPAQSSSSAQLLPTSPVLARPPMSPTSHAVLPPFAVPAPAYPGEFDDEDDDEGEDYGPEWAFGAPTNSADSVDLLERDARRLDLEAEIRLDDADQSAGHFVLYCGGGNVHHDDAELRPVDNQTHTSSRRKASAFSKPTSHSQTPRRSTGCGALIHVSAVPRRKYGVWIARGDASENVAPLNAEYFDCRALAKMMRSGCGCVREGVGCRICGNPLGTIFTPCQAAAAGLFSNSPSPSPSRPSTAGPTSPRLSISPSSPPVQSGGSYWLPRSQSAPLTPPPSPPSSVFTFFAGSVTPAPSYTFPTPGPTRYASPTPSAPTLLPPPPITASRRRWPTFTVRQSSVWAQDDVAVYEQGTDGDSRYDPDGEDEMTVRDSAPDTEPDSAEKFENGATMWVER